jgi:thioesterase domain-containing protein
VRVGADRRPCIIVPGVTDADWSIVMAALSTDEARAAIWSRLLNVSRHLNGRPSISRQRLPSIIPLRKGPTKNPLYFIGYGLWELRLAELICSDHSIFAIDVPWASAWRIAALEKRKPALPTMQALVAPYMSVLNAHAHFSPCLLAGVSFNGLMAFELAHQLQKYGGKVRAVMLLDSKSKYPRPASIWWEKLKQDWNQTNGVQAFSMAGEETSSFATLQWMCVSEFKHLWRQFKAARGQLGELTVIADDFGKPLPWAVVERIYANAANRYYLECLDSHGILFRANPSNDRPARVLDGSLGWRDLFRSGLEVVQVTGDHLTMMQTPHNLTLAREMSEVLERFCGR